MARTTNQRQSFITSVPDSTWTALMTAGQEAFLNGGNSLLLRFSWDAFPAPQHPHGMYVLMEELLFANGVLGAGGSSGQTCWVYPDVSSVCVRYSNLNGQGVAISVWQRSVAALAYNITLTWNIECTTATGPEEVRVGTVLRPTANRGWHIIQQGAANLAAAYATIGNPFNVSNCDRINVWVTYTRGALSAAGRGLLRIEKSIAPNTSEPTTITQWCPEIIQDGATFAATATGGQVDTYQEEACLSPSGAAAQNFNFTIDTAGYNWCRIRMADTDAANPGICGGVRFIEVGK